MIILCTSFGGSTKTSNINYAHMTWYMLNHVRKWDSEKDVKLYVGATRGHAYELASRISKNISGCNSIELDPIKDKFSSKIYTLKKCHKLASENQAIFYADCDVFPYGSIKEPMEKAANMSKLLVTEMRLKRKESDKKFRSWIVGIKKNKSSLSLLDAWLKETEKAGSDCTDQEGLWNAYLKLSTTKGDVIDYSKTKIPLCHTSYIKIGSKWERKGVCGCPNGWNTIREGIQSPDFLM